VISTPSNPSRTSATKRNRRWRSSTAGFELREGASHAKVYKDSVGVSVIPRHREIAANTVRASERQIGVKLS
jgi:hypothetical protein